MLGGNFPPCPPNYGPICLCSTYGWYGGTYITECGSPETKESPPPPPPHTHTLFASQTHFPISSPNMFLPMQKSMPPRCILLTFSFLVLSMQFNIFPGWRSGARYSSRQDVCISSREIRPDIARCRTTCSLLLHSHWPLAGSPLGAVMEGMQLVNTREQSVHIGILSSPHLVDSLL